MSVTQWAVKNRIGRQTVRLGRSIQGNAVRRPLQIRFEEHLRQLPQLGHGRKSVRVRRRVNVSRVMPIRARSY